MEEAVKAADGIPDRVRDLSRELWDVLIIGAGPAGSLAAFHAARAGLRALLVDAKNFPRDKVCGGYLNRRALQVLLQRGAGEALPADFGTEVGELELLSGHQHARFPLPMGRVIRRPEFDARLVEAARAAGAEVVTRVQATIKPGLREHSRAVTLAYGGTQSTARACAVICADGLARMSVRRLPEFATIASANSRVGIGAVIDDSSDLCSSGRLRMVVSREGYAGISRIDSHQLDIAAAVDATSLSNASPLEIIQSIFAAANFTPPVGLATATWRGTPPLTSLPQTVASQRVFLIGDAAGYVEPFTGEGMAAALESAAAVTPLVAQAARAWSPQLATAWQTIHRETVRNRQRTCEALAWILRRPWATFATLSTCRVWPAVATLWISRTTALTPSPSAKLSSGGRGRDESALA